MALFTDGVNVHVPQCAHELRGPFTCRSHDLLPCLLRSWDFSGTSFTLAMTRMSYMSQVKHSTNDPNLAKACGSKDTWSVDSLPW